MTKKTKKIILWVVGIWLVSSLFFACLTAIIESNRDKLEVQQEEPITDFSKIDPQDAHNIIGRWKLSSEIAPELNSAIVIFEKNDSFFYKETYDKGGSKTNLLRKDGNKYYDTESEMGEYFLISDGSLQLFDQEGEYGDGKYYSIKKLE